MASSLEGTGASIGFETSDEFMVGDTMAPEFVEALLKTIDCYVMGSRTYQTALTFEAKGLDGRTATNQPLSSLVVNCRGPGIPSNSTRAISRTS